jgi:Arf-GAP with coiled-coil, ANK repeat and PH domain-containing protein
MIVTTTTTTTQNLLTNGTIIQLESDVLEARRNHTRASLDFTVTLNEVLARKRFEFLERIAVYMHAQMTFFHQGYLYKSNFFSYCGFKIGLTNPRYECFKDVEPHLKSYTQYLQNVSQHSTLFVHHLL